MTLQSIGKYRAWPGNNQHDGVPTVQAGTVCDAAGEYESWNIQAPFAMAISHVAFKPQAVSGSPTENIRIENIDVATGLPDGTLWASNTNIAGVTTLTTSWATHALTATANITRGQVFNLKIGYQSGTSFTHVSLGNYTGQTAFPSRVTNTGTPTKSNMLGGRTVALGSSTSSFYCLPQFYPVSTISATTFTSASNPDRRGMRFQVPFTCQCIGIRFYPGASVGDITIAMYDDSNAILSSSDTAIDGDYFSGATAGHPADVMFDNAVTLSPSTWYQATVEATSATAVGFATYVVSSANYMGATPGGANCHYTVANDGTWDKTATTTVPYMDILIYQFDDGINAAGGKGLLT